MTAAHSGLIAILRGITPAEAPQIGAALHQAGFRAIEVPLNSPDPFGSIRALRAALPRDCAVGAGTVLSVDDVHRAVQAGADIIVSPNTNPEVIAATVAAGLRSYPGAATPTEAFAGYAAGARSIKLFPSSTIGIVGMKALASVLPAEVELLPVGGVEVDNLAGWLGAGAGGAGIGSSLYRPGRSAEQVAAVAEQFMAVWRARQDG